MQDVIGFWLRATVAATFVLSAGWKLRHSSEFQSVLRSIKVPRLAVGPLGLLVPLVEVAVATVLVVPLLPGRIGALTAVAVILALGVTLLRRDLGAGCGCWSGSNPERGPLLARTVVLLTMAVAGVILPPGPVSAELLVVLPIAVVFGGLIIELPTILQFLVHAEGEPS